MRIGMALGALLAGATLSAASEPPKTPPRDPDWLREPTPAQANAHLSVEALRIGGRAIIRCHVQENGALDGCAIASETQAGLGYGEALLAVAGGFQMSPIGMAKLPPNRLVLIPYYHFPTDTDPDWLRKPTQEELQVLWPSQAAKEGIGGKATVSCLVDIRGSAYDCVAVSEDPPGKGFGGAAIGLSQQFQFRPAKLHGQPVISAVNVPITWQRSDPFAVGGGKTLVDPAMAWLESPTFDDLAAVYPKKARAARTGGRANIGCNFGRDGRVKDCMTLMEAPVGQGFGHAAEQMAKHFVAPSTTVHGKPITEFAVQIPIVFDPSMLDTDQPAVGKPRWASLPSAEDTKVAFAEIAKSEAGTLRVMLTCKVQMGGGVGDCSVENGQQANQGLAQAAMTLTPHFKLTTWTVEGLPTVGGTVHIPLRYEGSTPPPATPPAKP